MRFASESTETIRHESWDEGESVTIRAQMSYAQQLAIQAHAVTFSASGDTVVDVAKFQRALLEQMIVLWTFVDEGGAAVPVSAATIERLQPATAEWIAAEIQTRNAPLSEGQKKA